MSDITGRRVYGDGGQLCRQQGDYGQDQAGDWWAWPPKCREALKLTKPGRLWSIEQHQDDTITVDPIIRVPGVWTGYLEKGVWTEA